MISFLMQKFANFSDDKTNMPTSRVSTQQLQEFDSTRVTICSNLTYCMFLRLEWWRLVCCTDPLNPTSMLPSLTLCFPYLIAIFIFSYYITKTKIQIHGCSKHDDIIEQLYSWIQCFLHTSRNDWYHGFHDTISEGYSREALW